MIQYGTAETLTVYLGYPGLTVSAKVGQNGGALAAIAGSITDNTDGSYQIPLTAANTSAAMVTLVVTAPGVQPVVLYLVTESNYTAALATALGTNNSEMATLAANWTSTLAGALTTFLAAYATSLATQTQAANILSAIAALPAPANASIATILTDVQSLLTSVAAGETSADMATKYSALQTAISGVTSSLESNLDSNIASILTDVGELLTNLASVPTAENISAAVWNALLTGMTASGSIGKAFATFLGWTPGQVTGYASGVAPPTVDLSAIATSEQLTTATNTLAEDIAGVSEGAGVTEEQLTAALAPIALQANLTALQSMFSAGMPQIVVVSPVGEDGSTLTLIRGNSYSLDGTHGEQVPITVPLAGFPSDLTEATFSIDLPGNGLTGLPVTAVFNSTAGTVCFTFALTVDQSNALYLGGGVYAIHATWDSEHRTDLVHGGQCNVV